MSRNWPRPTRRRFVALLGSSAVAGCGYRPGGGDVRWRSDAVGGFGTDRIELAGDTLYAIADSVRTFDLDRDDWVTGGQVTGYRTRDGETRFSEVVAGEFSAHAVGAGGAAAAFLGMVVRFGPDGELWRARVGDDVVGLGLANERVYAYTTEPALVAVADGEVRWRRELSVEDTTEEESTAGDLVGATESIAVVGHESGVTAFDPSGSRRWRRTNVDANSVTATDRGIYVVDAGILSSLSPDSGKILWSERVGDPISEAVPIVGEQSVYFGTEDIQVVDRSGETAWTITGAARGGGRPAVAADDSGVYAVRRGIDRREYTLETFKHDGSHRWSVGLDGYEAGPFAADSGILVGTGRDLQCHVR